ncbi:MAG: glycosyl hydrolase [Sphingobium sp.]|nr:MAG: glycosyl hydrolase [Sphingobium sp.]
MTRTYRRTAAALIGPFLLLASAGLSAQAWKSDQGDGTYRNPPLNADYPDPDIIRVGGDFYFATTTFANVPGLTILKSRDLINWRIATHVVPKLTGSDRYDLADGGAYRKGIYAPSLRYHQGRFYAVYTPVGQNSRIYSAPAIEGPWTMAELDREAFDPGLFFDTDGKGYIVTAYSGGTGDITLLSLDDSYSRVTGAQTIHHIKGGEGSKLVRRGDWYYLFNAIPSRLGLTVSRAKSLTGPWETRNQIDDTTGGHQGAIVDLPDGTDVGFVMLDAGAIGRVTNISPIFWQDGWPVWGTKDAPGRVPASARKPVQGQSFVEPPTSDEFTETTLGLQWQWNHNPDDTRWSLSERPGYLRLKATRADEFWLAKNTLIQKGQAPRSEAVVKLDTRGLRAGDQCGFGTLGKFNGQIAIVPEGSGRQRLAMRLVEDGRDGRVTHDGASGPLMPAGMLWLRTRMDFTNDKAQLAYSRNGRTWTDLGAPFPLAYDWRTGTFQGPQYALSCYNAAPNGGYLDVDWFHFSGWQP